MPIKALELLFCDEKAEYPEPFFVIEDVLFSTFEYRETGYFDKTCMDINENI